MKIEGKRIILTGAASGIGRALLQQLANYPTQIVVVDIDQPMLAEAVGLASQRQAIIHAYPGDLARQETVDEVFEEARVKMDGADIFIANAGRPYYEQVGEANWGHIADIFHLNVISALYAYQKLKSQAAGSDFRFVLLSSAMAHIAMPGYALYSATKAALHRFAEAARMELARPEQLMVVYPIATRTRFFQAASAATPLPWPSQNAEQVADRIVRGIRRDRRVVYPSATFAVILFLDRFQPLIRRLYQRYYLADLLNKKES
jgi:uncharacterized protein